MPAHIEVMNPFEDAEVKKVSTSFYRKYYHDAAPRHMMVGINPGRFGAGITGVPFTDPIRMTDVCGIKSSWQRKPELSSIFMYEMMEAFGGVEAFYQRFYITAYSPLGFVSQGKNLNYYDDTVLDKAILPFARTCMEKQLNWPVQRELCFCIGEGKNYDHLSRLNDIYLWFEKIVPLPHPRFIMQYKRMQIDEYIHLYLSTFESNGLR